MANGQFEALLQSLMYKAQAPQRTMGYAVDASKSIGDVGRQKSQVQLQQQQAQEKSKQEANVKLSEQIKAYTIAGYKAYNPDGTEYSLTPDDILNPINTMQGKGIKFLHPEKSADELRALGLEPTRYKGESGLEYENIEKKESKSRINPSSGQGLNIITNLRKEYAGQIKDFKVVRTQYSKMDTALREALASDVKGKNAADQSLIMTFNKILDPNSVVRESEYARYGEGVSLVNRVKGFVEKVERGSAGITDADRKEIVNVAKKFYENAGKDYQQTRKQYGDIYRAYFPGGSEKDAEKLVLGDDLSITGAMEQSDPLGIRR